MIESLRELGEDIEKRNGRFYLFEGGNLEVLQQLNKAKKIKSIGFNYDYTPYAKKRDDEIIEWAKSQKIEVHSKEDYVLYPILEKKNVSPKTGNPYLVFTPFKNFCLKELTVPKPDTFTEFNFQKAPEY
jgi:deoxyribodipyrimidine photo-lyase